MGLWLAQPARRATPRPAREARLTESFKSLLICGINKPQSRGDDCHAPLSPRRCPSRQARSEEHTSELQSLMRISYADFCLKKKTTKNRPNHTRQQYTYKT